MGGDPEKQFAFDIPASGLVTPSDAAPVFNYIEGSNSKNDGQAISVRHQGIDDTIPVSADANIVAVTPATAADITAGQKFFRSQRPAGVAPTIVLRE